MRADAPNPGSCHDTSVPPENPSATDHSGLSRADEHFGFGTSTSPVARGNGALPAGTNLGGVMIVRMIAEGGMGRVYEGQQAAPERGVAVKVLRDGFASASLVRRFEYEARVLARLRHPNIAQIFTFGTYDNGAGEVPFFVMEMIEAARPITRHAHEAGLGVREIVALFRQVCAAVAHGHQKGVIHRDLKPGNILVDAAGEPKVIDFGVARSIDPDHGDPTQMTRAGDVVGTLRYMSPEQLGVGDGDMDARSDVYALGLVLHEVLTGSLPYDLRGMSFVEAARILDDPAPAPTAAIERVARGAGCAAVDARALATIVATCLEKQPGSRYATAVEVEAELGRWLAGRRSSPGRRRPRNRWCGSPGGIVQRRRLRWPWWCRSWRRPPASRFFISVQSDSDGSPMRPASWPSGRSTRPKNRRRQPAPSFISPTCSCRRRLATATTWPKRAASSRMPRPSSPMPAPSIPLS